MKIDSYFETTIDADPVRPVGALLCSSIVPVVRFRRRKVLRMVFENGRNTKRFVHEQSSRAQSRPL